eukprot:scaffold433_cov260-Chaetoceros_neogracile.AAC.61
MCGRAAQSIKSIEAAEELLQRNEHCIPNNCQQQQSRNTCNTSSNGNDLLKFNFDPTSSSIVQHDNYNLAPGAKTIIFHAERNHAADDDANHSNKLGHRTKNISTITSSAKTWGLLPKHGTINHPLPEGPGKHYQSIMYNARSDTLYEKKTFSKLALDSQTCLWPVDGYFEWKQDDGNALKLTKGGKGKQPYFIQSAAACAREQNKNNERGEHGHTPLFIPGLWNRIKTGRKTNCDDGGEFQLQQEEYIETFTLITTEACPSLEWLHHRQPILLDSGNLDLAMEWLLTPDPHVLQRMREQSWGGGLNYGNCGGDGNDDDGDDDVNGDGDDNDDVNGNGNDNGNNNGNHPQSQHQKQFMRWYPVTKRVGKVGYKNKDCVDPIQIEKVASVKSFFMAGGKNASGGTVVQKKKKRGGIAGDYVDVDSPFKRAKVEIGSMHIMQKTESKSPMDDKAMAMAKKIPMRVPTPVADKKEGSIASFFFKQAPKK